MLRLGMLLVTVTVLSGCSTSFSDLGGTNRGVCDSLENPMVNHAGSLVELQKRTPDLVLRTGATLIQAYRAGCD